MAEASEQKERMLMSTLYHSIMRGLLEVVEDKKELLRQRDNYADNKVKDEEEEEEFSMCKALEDWGKEIAEKAKAEAKAEAMAEAKAERERSIQMFICDNLEEKIQPARILLKLQKYFDITEGVAENYLQQYAK